MDQNKKKGKIKSLLESDAKRAFSLFTQKTVQNINKNVMKKKAIFLFS